MAPLSDDAKKQIEEAYASFRATLRDIAHEHRTTVTDLLTQLDEQHVEDIEKRIQSTKET
jgi:predicted DNA-binding ribbon-helix-helix protein